MTFTDGDSWWRDIPNGILEQYKNQTVAQQWGDQARADVAQQWGDSVRATLPPPSDSLTNPLGTGNAPDMAAAPAQASSPSPASAPSAASLPAPNAPVTAPLDFNTAAQSARDAANGTSGLPAANGTSGLPSPNAPVTAPPSLSTSASTRSSTPADATQQVTPSSPVTAPMAPSPTSTRQPIKDVSQFNQQGLTYDEALAACGPAAAVRLASIYGNNIPLNAALNAAKQVGWTLSGGMNGIDNEKRLLDNLGVPASIDRQPDTNKIISDVQNGNPVTLSTTGHYFTLTGYDPQTGKFFVGESGKAYRGGSDQLSLRDMQRLAGPINGALFVDAPTSPQPSAAANPTNQSSGNPLIDLATSAASKFGIPTGIFTNLVGAESSWDPTAVSKAGAQGLTQLEPDTAKGLGVKDVFNPQQNLEGGAKYLSQLYQQFGNWRDALIAYNEGPGRRSSGVILPESAAYADKILGGASVAPSVGGPDLGPQTTVMPTQTSASSLPVGMDLGKAVVQTAGNVIGQGFSDAVQAARDAVGSIGNAITQAGQNNTLVQGQTIQAQGNTALGNAVASAPQAAFGTPEQPSGLSQQATSGGPNAALTGGEQALGQYVLNGTGPIQDAKQVAAGALSNAAQNTGNVPVLSGAASAALNTAGGLLGSPSVLDNVKTLQDIAQKYGPTPDPNQMTPEDQQRWAQAGLTVGGLASPLHTQGISPITGPAQSTNPLIRRTGQMLQAGPPTPPTDSLATKLVRNLTNRYVNLDQFQEQTAKLAGLDPTQLPQNTDAMALVRLSSDPAADIRVQQELKPAIQAVGDDRQWLSTMLIHQNNVDVGAALGNPNRVFPGGFSAADSAQVLQDLPQELGPARYAKVQQAAQQVNQYVAGIRQRMVDSGIISQATASDWATKYPNWVPTRILDYMDETANAGRQLPGKISLGSSGVQRYTLEGTAKFAEDPLGSLVALANQVESRARKNELVNALVNLDQLRPQGQQLLQLTKRAPTAGETVVQRLVNGKVERYVAPPQLATAINGPAITQAPGYVRAFTNFQRAVTTILSPAFALVRNPSLDVPEYLTRELSRSGGNPMALPGIIGDLVQGYREAAAGTFQGEFRGATARMLQAGAGQSGLATRTAAERGQTIASLGRGNIMEIKSVGDVQRILKDILTLKPVGAAAERTELGPRTASFIRAERAGATPARSALAARTVTIDFNEGGTLTKAINQIIPFFNVGFQGTAQLPRMWRENPAGFVNSVLLTVGLPQVAAQAWNRADPQRSQDYNDVPQYLKDQGIVIMAPNGLGGGDSAPTDAQGNRKPQFWWINMRGFAPFSTAAREATDRGLQTVTGRPDINPQDALGLLNSMFWAASPIRANSIGDVPGSVGALNYPIPGLGTALQLQQNRDFFRNSDIATARNDQAAPALAKGIAGGITSLAQLVNPQAQVHPSQVNFAVQELLGGVGSMALGAGDIGRRQDNTPQTLPVLGGAAKALGIRGDTGQSFRDAQSERAPADLSRLFQSAGLPPSYQPAPADATVTVGRIKVPLLQSEQTKVQQLMNQSIADDLRAMATDPTWASIPNDRKQKIITNVVERAHKAAERQVLSEIPDAEIGRRLDAQAAAVP